MSYGPQLSQEPSTDEGCCSSPISLFIATLLLAFWRPIMSDLAAALPISGANYAYL